MNKIEMKPTTENIINMLDKNAIGRNQYVETFLEMLDNVDENFTIFINGKVFCTSPEITCCICAHPLCIDP